MKKSIIILLLIGMLCGCEEEDFYPKGLYGYQVDRLISGGESKLWILTASEIDGQAQAFEDCGDSLKLYVEERTMGIAVYQLNTCNPTDSTFFGYMTSSFKAKGLANQYLFTDSLLFEEGTEDFFLVKEVTSLYLKVYYSRRNTSYSMNFHAD